ncbi:MAG: ParA family protein [Deltaproteobacteria bacterium]|nr:ParA family protein [Deltaproteobacteria bacterium]
MYVATFYSFKGGVGRTMALVNVAVELAKRGRRVLAVDFDLEAPGLDTFDVMQPREQVPGIIDFVSQYLVSGRAPEASQFISETSHIGEQGGGLWIMPSGRPDTYSSNFNQIDWGVLYDERDGYLLFEDLKEQWNRVVKPDYVLIDSRTGHTDTGGICSRQLPDAVVILFFPNEQNLRGLTRVVSDIRAETVEPRKKTIELHFVMSNVPDLDDEDRILDHKIKAFQEQLGFRREPMIVHRYDSLSLLNQVVFAKDRPRSRLAEEYRDLARAISERNWADRDGALDYIRRMGRDWRGMEDETIQARDSMLLEIERAHSKDGEVLFRLGELRADDGQAEWAASLTYQAIDAGYDGPDGYLARSRIRARNGDPAGAEEDALRVLESREVSPPMARAAISRIRSPVPQQIAESVAVVSMDADEQMWLAGMLNHSPDEALLAIPILQHIVRLDDFSATNRQSAEAELALAYMAVGRCSDTVQLLRPEGRSIGDMGIEDAFNYGMAVWGDTGTIETQPFERVLQLHSSIKRREAEPNYLQCMAIAYWATGDNAAAARYADEAEHAVETRRSAPAFSCWRYCRVNTGTFVADMNEIRALINGDTSRTPFFMTEGTAASTDPQNLLF